MTYVATRTRRAPVPPRDTGSAQPRHDRNPHHQPAPAQQEPGFLTQVKRDLADLVAAVLPDNPPEYVVAELWPLIGKKLAASYWNGVGDGASGKVKPKERRPSAAVERPGMTYVVSGTWQPNAPRGGAKAEGD